MGFSNVLDALKGKKAKAIDDDEIEAGELSGAKVEIERGDSRLAKGISRSNLTDSERNKLDEYRKKKSKE